MNIGCCVGRQETSLRLQVGLPLANSNSSSIPTTIERKYRTYCNSIITYTSEPQQSALQRKSNDLMALRTRIAFLTPSNMNTLWWSLERQNPPSLQQCDASGRCIALADLLAEDSSVADGNGRPVVMQVLHILWLALCWPTPIHLPNRNCKT